MSEINGVLIIEKDGTVLLNYKTIDIQSEKEKSDLLSGVIMTILAFIKTIGEDKFTNMELGKSKFFISKDETTKLILVLEATKKAKDKKMEKSLEQLQKKIHQVYFDSLFSPEKVREYVKNELKNDLEIILKDVIEKRFSSFFEAI